MRDHAAPKLEILPITGLPEFRPGTDLPGEIAKAAPWLRSGDVLVVTSKIVSKAEGRLIKVPSDPEARDAERRKLVEQEAIRVVARIARTVITQNHLGIVQAASGIDASNVEGDEVALLPADPDASALALRNGLRERLGIEVAVLITDTMGRAWRIGQTDAAIGSSGLRVLHAYRGQVDGPGNELATTPRAPSPRPAARSATALTACARSSGDRTTPPAPTASRPTSNCGFTINNRSPVGFVHRASAGSTNPREMNDRSATVTSTCPPMSCAVRSRTLVRSCT